MEGIQGLRRQAAAPVQRAVPAAEAKKAAAAKMDTFQSVLTREQRAEQAAKTPDLPNFAKMTDRQKLSALATLHDATDYSGMTDVEKYKLMRDRFEAAFPCLGAYESGVIGRDSAHYFGASGMARPVTGTATLIQKEQARQWDSQGLQDISRLHREAYYPGMTDGEAAQAASRRYGGGFAAQACVLQELKTCGLGDQEAIQGTLTYIRAKLVQLATGARQLEDPPILETDNATQEKMVWAMATCSPIHTGSGTDWGALQRALEGSGEAWDQKAAKGFSQHIQGIIDGIVEEIIKGEDQTRAPGQTAGKPAEGAAPE